MTPIDGRGFGIVKWRLAHSAALGQQCSGI
jgi:hypothetical protein